jgi:hypothetical protein
MAISLLELLRGHVITDLSIDEQHNLEELQKRINIIREAWGKPMTVTSGFRSMQDHLRIYSELAFKRGQPFDRSKVPMKSAHLSGSAVDISDPDGSLYEWCHKNIPLLEKTELWCEMKDDQHRVHFQIYPPKSGNRFFYP